MAPQNSVPPQLPPSVEEAYRRKCVELKRRNHQVEEANDGARLRIARIKRQVEKLRVERAFLLEQLTKRTSTNVEDSEGSPSPPPGNEFDFTLVPKDPAALSDTEPAPPRKPKTPRNKRPKANANADAASEAAGDNQEPADTKDEELPDAAPAQDSATPGMEEPKESDLARLSTENPPGDRDLEKDGELPGESDDSAIGAFNMFAAWRRPQLANQDDPDVDIRAVLLGEWGSTDKSTKESLATKFKELGSSSKILEEIRDNDWEPPAIPTKILETDATSQNKDEDVEMEDGETTKSDVPAKEE